MNRNTMRTTPKRVEDIGLSPFELKFRGKKRTDTPHITAISFNESVVNESDILNDQDLDAVLKIKNTCWLNIAGLHDVDLMKKLMTLFDIDANIMAEIMNPAIRPKIQEFDNGLFITMKIIRQQRNQILEFDNFSLLLRGNFVITFQEEEGTTFDPIRERIRKHKTKIRTGGPDYLAFALLDVVIDNYTYIVSMLGEDIENLESGMNENLDKKMPVKINHYKQELNFIRRNIKPAREMILTLAKIETESIRRSNRIHFKELQDNMNEANELADSYREMLYDLLNIYHTSATSRLNDIMKLLTIISVIFIPLTFIVGVYGTNFDYIPELKWSFGYFAMWGVMLIVVAVMVWFFRRKDWF